MKGTSASSEEIWGGSTRGQERKRKQMHHMEGRDSWLGLPFSGRPCLLLVAFRELWQVAPQRQRPGDLHRYPA